MARKWGEHNCNAPPELFNSMFDFIEEQQIQYDMVFWLGDNPGHAYYAYKREDVLNSVQIVADIIRKRVKEHIPVYPVIGNHDIFPMNEELFEEPGEQNLIDIGEIFSVFLGEEESRSFNEYGYYTTLYKDTKLRIIVLNTNFYMVFNMAAWKFLADPSPQISWLVDTLLKAEEEEEKVILLSHASPGGLETSHDHDIWINKIMERFGHIIRTHQAGHYHTDLLHIHRHSETQEEVGVTWSNGFMTTQDYSNPNFKIIEFSSVGLEEGAAPEYSLFEAHKYYFDLEGSYKVDVPLWKKEYSFLEHFQVKNLSPSSLLELLEEAKENEDTAIKLLTTLHNSGPKTVGITCDQQCRLKLYCEWSNAVLHHARDCQNIPRFYIPYDHPYYQYRVLLGRALVQK